MPDSLDSHAQSGTPENRFVSATKSDVIASGVRGSVVCLPTAVQLSSECSKFKAEGSYRFDAKAHLPLTGVSDDGGT